MIALTAYSAEVASASGKPGTIGAPSGSPFIAAKPLAASTSVPNPGPRRARTGLAPAGNAKDHESGMPRLQRLRRESQPLQRAGHERFHHDVEPRQHAQQERTALRRLEVERDEPLVARVDLPPERLSLGRPLPERIAGAWLLHLDDVGAEVGEQHAGDAAGHHPRQVEDPHAGERFHAFGLFLT